MAGAKGCKKATRHEDPKGRRDGGLSGISTPRQLVDPLSLVKRWAGWTHTAFGKLFLANAGSSAFRSGSSLHWGHFSVILRWCETYQPVTQGQTISSITHRALSADDCEVSHAFKANFAPFQNNQSHMFGIQKKNVP